MGCFLFIMIESTNTKIEKKKVEKIMLGEFIIIIFIVATLLSILCVVMVVLHGSIKTDWNEKYELEEQSEYLKKQLELREKKKRKRKVKSV